jgi:hypothetical protein
MKKFKVTYKDPFYTKTQVNYIYASTEESALKILFNDIEITTDR